MKITPIIFCSALAVFLATIATSKHIPVQSDDTNVPLNFQGIDTLEVQSDYTAQISVRDDVASSLSYDFNYDTYRTDGDDKVRSYNVEITGNRMLISKKVDRYGDFVIVIPSTVKNLIVYNASVSTLLPVDAMHVQVSKSLEWQGDARNLRISDSRDYSDPNKGCNSDIVINNGAIDNLFVETKKGMLKLKALDQIKSVTLQAGPDASLSISPISSMGRVRLQDFPDSIMPTESAAKKLPEQDKYGCHDS